MADHGTASRYSNEGCRCDPCRLAHNAQVKRYRLSRKANLDPTDPTLKHGTVNAYNLGCRCQMCARANSERKRGNERARARSGLTQAELDVRKLGACECCGVVPRVPLYVDHDHVTDAFRGMLCNSCNTGIGKLGDSIEGLRKAIAYLERASG